MTMNDRFVYVTYIRTTPEKLWDALTKPEFTRLYWFGTSQVSEWKKGASWRLTFADGRTSDTGEILEIVKPKRLVIKWRNELQPEMKAEGDSVCTFDLDATDDIVRLTVTHEIGVAGSKFIKGISGGWPAVLSNLKSLLETGNAFAMPAALSTCNKG
jgi:uncharacterized protein YndB with AHSA1/START domain